MKVSSVTFARRKWNVEMVSCDQTRGLHRASSERIVAFARKRHSRDVMDEKARDQREQTESIDWFKLTKRAKVE